MKFATIALIGAVSAQDGIPCTDDDANVKCMAGACCGFLIPAEGDPTRLCSKGNKEGAAAYDGEDVFQCDDPNAVDEGASKIVIGASALVAAVYMMWIWYDTLIFIDNVIIIICIDVA